MSVSFLGLLRSQIDSGEYLIKNNGIPIDSLLTTPMPELRVMAVAGGISGICFAVVVYYSYPHHEIPRLASVKFHLFTFNGVPYNLFTFMNFINILAVHFKTCFY